MVHTSPSDRRPHLTFWVVYPDGSPATRWLGAPVPPPPPPPPRPQLPRGGRQDARRAINDAYRARHPPSPPPTSTAERVSRADARLALFEARRAAHEEVWEALVPNKDAIPTPKRQHAILTAAEVEEFDRVSADVVSNSDLII